MAWKSGCKGTTIYRSGSRENEVLELKKEDSGEDEMSQEELDALQDDYDRVEEVLARRFSMVQHIK